MMSQENHHDVALSEEEETRWQKFLQGINGFTEDFFAEGRKQGDNCERESLDD
ncbi:MAG: hypothetical protein Q4C56_09825 [Peptococcaceae bacterium]|nr:hypothetical protein [Peptococcaceae bacterium]